VAKRILCVWKLVGPALGCLQGIQLTVSLFGCFLDVRGHITGAYTPFGSGIGENQTVFTCGEFLDFLAAFTLFDNGMAFAAIELAAGFAHKRALHTFFNACTNHFNHILSL